MKAPFSDSDPEYCLFGIPYDAGDFERKNSKKGINEIRKSLWSLYGFNPETNRSIFDKRVKDMGDIKIRNGNFEQSRKEVKKFVNIIKDRFVMGLLGEHTFSAVILEEINEKNVVVLDAHLDLWDDYKGNKWSPACTVKRIVDLGKNVICCGARDISKEEWENAKEFGVEIKQLEKISREFYLSIDMDAFDPGIAPASVCPRHGGLYYKDVSDFIKKNANNIKGMDFSGICQGYDKGQTAMLAAQLIVDLLTSRE